jgi:predicted small metal-binding protein
MVMMIIVVSVCFVHPVVVVVCSPLAITAKVIKFKHFIKVYNTYELNMKKILACSDVGLDCGYILEGKTEDEVMENAVKHVWEIHAIKPEEMTSEMKVKIRENIHES